MSGGFNNDEEKGLIASKIRGEKKKGKEKENNSLRFLLGPTRKAQNYFAIQK